MDPQGNLDYLVNLAYSCGMYFSVAEYWAKNLTSVNAKYLHRSGDYFLESRVSRTMEVFQGRTHLTWNFRWCSAKLENDLRRVKWEAAWFITWTASIGFLAHVQDLGTTVLLKMLVLLSVNLECEVPSLTVVYTESHGQILICKSW